MKVNGKKAWAASQGALVLGLKLDLLSTSPLVRQDPKDPVRTAPDRCGQPRSV